MRRPAARGELRVQLPVSGLVHTRTTEQGLHFADARTGLGFRYGHGTWVDGKGQRTAVPAEFVDGQIQLRVPEAVLAASAYPAVLDPMVTQEMIIDGRLVTADTSVRTNASLAFDGTQYLVVWRNVRGNLSSIYGTRVSTSGTVLDTTGIVVSNGPGLTAVPFVASNGTDFYVVWAQNSYTWRVMGTRVSSSGSVAIPGGERLSSSALSQYWPRVASNETDYLVVWYRYSNSYDADVFARRVSSTGELDTAEIPIAAVPEYNELAPSVASNGTMYLVGWSDERGGYSRPYATRVSNAGVVQDGSGILLTMWTSLQSAVTVASNGTDFLAIWVDYRAGTDRDIYGTRVTGSGTVVDASGFAIGAASGFNESYPALASDGTNYLVAWSAWNTSNSTFQALASRVLSSGSSPVLDSPSLVLSPSGGTTSTRLSPKRAPATSWRGRAMPRRRRR